jgi:uncharacterized membrane protein YoaK (UPF0700 family)
VRLLSHLLMLAVFVAGVAVSAILCHIFQGKAAFFALIPLTIILIDFLYADVKKDRGLDRIPRGH